jgi:hypothetical protein
MPVVLGVEPVIRMGGDAPPAEQPLAGAGQHREVGSRYTSTRSARSASDETE